MADGKIDSPIRGIATFVATKPIGLACRSISFVTSVLLFVCVFTYVLIADSVDGYRPLLSSKSPRSAAVHAFRHFIDGSLAFASSNHACRNLVSAFPQRSPPSLFTTAACGGMRSTPDCRPRRAILHLSYSYASPCGPALLVTQDPSATLTVMQGVTKLRPNPEQYIVQRNVEFLLCFQAGNERTCGH